MTTKERVTQFYCPRSRGSGGS